MIDLSCFPAELTADARVRAALAADRTLAAGMFGLMAGDILGVPYQHTSPEHMPRRDWIRPVAPWGFDVAHRGAPPGLWSDDTAHAFCLLESLLAHDGLDLGDFGRRLHAWLHTGHNAPRRMITDVGRQTATAINRLHMGWPAHLAGPREASHLGNGALMRVLPLALWHRGSDAELAWLAARQSLVTHGHPLSQAACAMYSLWVRELCRARDGAWQRAHATLRAISRRPAPAGMPVEDGAMLPWRVVDQVLHPRNKRRLCSNGKVVETLWCVRIAVEHGGDALGAASLAAAFGGDTDTAASLAGGASAAVDGVADLAAWELPHLGGWLPKDIREAQAPVLVPAVPWERGADEGRVLQ
jgi:ADP-ribosylglycohydrolase